MGDTNEAIRDVVAHVDARQDVLVGGASVRARQLMAEAAARLAATANVVSVSSPIGELGLSALIAQLSGRPELEEQDDAVLELGFKRLRAEGQTVLLLLAPEGVSRSALRYIQHVARHLPRLTMVVHDSPALATNLEDAGLAALRDRLQAASRVQATDAPERIATGALAIVPPAAGSPPMVIAPVDARPLLGSARPGSRLAVLVPPARRPALWLGAALSAAAIGGIAFMGRSQPIDVAAGTTAHADIPLETAIVPEPRLASAADPAAAKPPVPAATVAAAPALAVQPPSAAAKLPQIALATPLPTIPLPTLVAPAMPSPSVAHPDPVVAAPPQRVARSARVPQLRRPDAGRREAARFTPEPPYWPAPHYQPPPGYEPTVPYDDMPPRWVRRERPGREAPYIGTFAMDPYGMRTFRYDP